MKLWIICILIILMFTILSVLNIQYVTRIVDWTCEDLLESVYLFHSGKSYASSHKLDEAERHWKDNLIVLGVILPHDEIDAIITTFAELKANLNSMDSDDYYSTAAIMMVQLNHIRDMQYPLPQNVF